MFIGTSQKIMGEFAVSGRKIVVWIATAVMGVAAIGNDCSICIFLAHQF
ncbi:MAG: hypothetical protein WA728_15420 [Xanthobacteraceae bacterium]